MRRKVAAIVILIGVVLVGQKLVGSFEHAPVPVEVRYLLPPGTTGLDVVVTPTGGGPARAQLTSTDPGREVISHSRLPSGDNAFAITLAFGEVRRTVTRTIEAQRDAVVRIDLSHENP
jgi:hypothetical protein